MRRPFACPKEPVVEYQSRREARIAKLRSIKFDHDKHEQKGEWLERI
jgi:hypothetical protein